MDPALMNLLPTGGVAGVLVVVIVYLLRTNAQDREQYQTHMANQQAQHLDEMQNINAEHARQLGRVEDRLKDLETSNQQVLRELEQERLKRYAAEEAAHIARQQLLSAEGGRRVGDAGAG